MSDGFLIETDIEEEPMGYYTSNYDYPACNHIDGVTNIFLRSVLRNRIAETVNEMNEKYHREEK